MEGLRRTIKSFVRRKNAPPASFAKGVAGGAFVTRLEYQADKFGQYEHRDASSGEQQKDLPKQLPTRCVFFSLFWFFHENPLYPNMNAAGGRY